MARHLVKLPVASSTMDHSCQDDEIAQDKSSNDGSGDDQILSK